MTRRVLVCASFAASLVAAACSSKPATQAAPPASQNRLPASIVDPYLTIQQALFHDSIEGVRQNAGLIATAASSLGAPGVKIDTAAVRLAAAGNVADARPIFGDLTDAMTAYMGAMHLTAPEGVRTAFCPMMMKEWLQKGETIENPYYGSQMPTCGSFR
jgi:membrane fusion protein, copper/silver efflux system